ncbi:MAG: PaaI family thioesterase [Sedimentibacter sp.]|uniref:PaaI family thioesterase n=1 Tax=Sedimentibacter sp. TaxID=1960295 RepID=UPI00298265BC|nr:PaaI family thioesterase [Sedimentibacter sp.]MDW5300184.1 PaaI family thioesterase [Sedimentibacter sp.]
MKYKVNKKQLVSKDCFVCGTENQGSLRSKFYELENGELMSISTPMQIHQSYPDRMHGGVNSAILDEVIGRAIMIDEPDAWGVTVELTIKYKKPVPLDNPVKAVARITRNTRLIFEGTGEILLEDGSIAATGYAKYVKMTIEKLANDTGADDSLMIEDVTQAPAEVEI